MSKLRFTITHSCLLSVLLAAATGCVVDEEVSTTDEPAEATAPPSVLARSANDPQLRWVMHGRPGFARLLRQDASGVVQLVREVPAGAVQWRPVAVAGDRLLWQSTTTNQLSLFRLDAAGNILSHRLITPPTGFLARGLAIEQQNVDCPPPADSALTYLILLERPATIANPFEPPRLLRVVDGAPIAPSVPLPFNASFRTVRELRRIGGDFFALAFRETSNPESGGVTYLLRQADGSFSPVQTTLFDSTRGAYRCIADNPSVPCPDLDPGVAPGAGYRLASLAWAMPVGYLGAASNPRLYALWSVPGDGRATAFVLQPGSSMVGPGTVLDDPSHASTGESLAPTSQSACSLFDPWTPPRGWPSRPAL